MGIHFSIQLYFPAEHLQAALSELDKITDQSKTWLSSVELPNGKRISFRHEPEALLDPRIDHSPDRLSLSFDTVLLFKLDEFTTAYELYPREFSSLDDARAFLESSGALITLNGVAYRRVGYLSVIVVIGLKFVEISISAVGSSQNALLRYSAAVHEAMTEILTRAQGIAGLINVEIYDLLLLTDPSRIVRIDFDVEERFRDGYAIDEITEEIIRRLHPPQ